MMRTLHLTAAFVGVLLFPLGAVSASAGSPVGGAQPGLETGAMLKVRQLGDDTVSVVDGVPLLEAGGEYVLFLTPSGLKHKADQFGVTGDAGEFRCHSDGTADRLDKRSRKLPARTTVESIRQVVKELGTLSIATRSP